RQALMSGLPLSVSQGRRAALRNSPKCSRGADTRRASHRAVPPAGQGRRIAAASSPDKAEWWRSWLASLATGFEAFEQFLAADDDGLEVPLLLGREGVGHLFQNEQAKAHARARRVGG